MQKDFYDFVVVGAGAAGLTAAQYGARSGLDTLLIDSSDAGGQALNIFTLENFPGFFPAVKGRTFIDNMQAQAQSFGAEIALARVKSIDKIKNQFIIKTDKGSVSCYTVLIATGAEHRKLGAKGESEFNGRGVSYCATCDGAFYKDKITAVNGGGDVAVEDAIFLSRFCKKVYLIHRRNELRATKILQDELFALPNVEVIWDSVVKEIKGQDTVTGLNIENVKDHSQSDITIDGIFVAIGIHPSTDLFLNVVECDEQGYVIAGEDGATSAPGIFVAGDSRKKRLRQIVTAVADGANAVTSVQDFMVGKEK